LVLALAVERKKAHRFAAISVMVCLTPDDLPASFHDGNTTNDKGLRAIMWLVQVDLLRGGVGDACPME
jgi:hypothetical protein